MQFPYVPRKYEKWSNLLTYLKFIFSKKATKIDEIFTVDLTVTTYCQIDGEDLSIFVVFSENVNFKWRIFSQPGKIGTGKNMKS